VYFESCGIPVERLNGGRPILQPTGNWWESGVTFNSAAVYLDRSPVNDPLICTLLGLSDLDDPRLRDGVVALHYRARPKDDPGYKWNRSFVGLALFTPWLEPLQRHEAPLLLPGESPDDPDFLGVEDPRITRIGDTFYAVYCGAPDFPEGAEWKVITSMAYSHDLLHWEKLGVIEGDVNAVCNKDAVLFPEAIDGNYFMLHRPMVGRWYDFYIHLAMSDAPTGAWKDCGRILAASVPPECTDAWVGAGTTPIPLGGKRYLEIFHTGHLFPSRDKEYHLDLAILNFERFSPEDAARIVEKRIDRFMVPETEAEISAPFSDSVANVVFACGAYRYDDHLYVIYGGGDTYILAARVPWPILMDHLDRAPVLNAR
jgi:predicted GH43/DUF377 family glycosyl hydrolase